MRIAVVGQVRSLASDVYSDITPIGAILLAQLARERGHEVRKIEMRVDRPEEWKRDLLDFQPDLLCFTVFTNWYYFYGEIVQVCRRILPDCRMVMGGPHVSGVQEWTLEDAPEVDYAIYGEGEKGFLGLLDLLEGKGAADAVPNLLYRQNGSIQKNCAAPELTPAELDLLPYPAYDLLPEFDFISPFGRKAMVITSRGCYFRCKFCFPQFIGDSVRSHSPAYVIGLTRRLYQESGVRYLILGDALFPPKRQWLDEFLDRWEQEKLDGLRWAFTTRVKFIKEDHYRRMKRLGLTVVPVGVETADDEILKDIDKEITVADVRTTLAMLRRVGLPALTNFMVGHRLDTPESVAKILPFLQEISPHLIQVSSQIPLPGTPLFDLVPEDRKRYYLHEWDFPSINQRGFAKPISEYLRIAAGIRINYYGSLRFLWRNSILWFLQHPMDSDSRIMAGMAVRFWLAYTRKKIAGTLMRYRIMRPVILGLKKWMAGSPHPPGF